MHSEPPKSDNPRPAGQHGSHDELTLELRLVVIPEDLQAGVNPVVYFRTTPGGGLKFINLSQARVWLTVRKVEGDDAGR